MPTTVLAIVIVSTFMHATWNLLVRGHADKQTMMLRMLVVITTVGLVPVMVGELLSPSMSPQMWLWAAIGGSANGLYYIFLARSLTVADFATAFPVIRALPVILIALGDVARGHPLTPVGWAAVVIVAAGCMLAPLESFRGISPRRYWRTSTVWILLAAFAAVGYTLSDKAAMDLIKQSTGGASISIGARYQYFHLMFSLIMVVVVGRPFRDGGKPTKPSGWLVPAVAAGLNFAGYCMILYCYQIVAQAGYVWAMRQFSIVIGVILAFVIFKEGGRLVRLTGAALITTGIIVIKLGG